MNYLSSKANRVEATENAVLAEKLEKRTLNNSSGLRAVCDLEGMRSKLCAKAFKGFISFMSEQRGYRVKEPWTNVMFIDGTQLARVNFALNSSSEPKVSKSAVFKSGLISPFTGPMISQNIE